MASVFFMVDPVYYIITQSNIENYTHKIFGLSVSKNQVYSPSMQNVREKQASPILNG